LDTSAKALAVWVRQSRRDPAVIQTPIQDGEELKRFMKSGLLLSAGSAATPEPVAQGFMQPAVVSENHPFLSRGNFPCLETCSGQQHRHVHQPRPNQPTGAEYIN